LAGASFGSCGSLSTATSLWQSVHLNCICPCTDAANFALSTPIDLPPDPLAARSAWHIRQVSLGDAASTQSSRFIAGKHMIFTWPMDVVARAGRPMPLPVGTPAVLHARYARR
jgi:hypothetical protein